MTVELWQYVSDLKKIGSNYVDFNITDSLNGYLNATQNTGFRKKTKHEHIFSTKEPVELFVNVTDSFRSPPTMMCNWYIDDKLLETHNCSKLVCEFNKTERHTIKAVAMVNTDGYEDCSGKRYEKDPNGTFYMTVHMKDPVGYLFMLGNKTVQLGQGINLTAIWQQGSPPFNFTWLLKEEHGDRVLNHFSHTLTSTSSNISLSASMLPAVGRYDLMVYVENDVSMISYRQLLLTVHKERTDPEHSPYTVVLSVIGGLVTMTIIVLVFVKAREVQERRRHIETADFDFHPNLLSSSYVAAGTSGETVSEKWTTLLGRLAGLCKSAEGMSKMSTSGYKPLRKYGTMEGSINA
ncbi:hypothetical protein DPMN_025474 [Dreissena polymorpha]|uniref:Uncharacterized protein n=2 Tax=Dreissena polymorpha TaxID=45954 RepID=A0A9D4LPC7_DREPO|nr:hypothetical protein DPMN_025474 [Dreissena polymorpha]